MQRSDIRRRWRSALGPAFVQDTRHSTLEGHAPADVVDLRDVGPGRIVVLIPAHNEEDGIEATLASLAAQTRPADQIIVIADCCTDKTAELARACGVQVIETVDNTQAKAGALNQVLNDLLPRLSDDDAVLIMDADTILTTVFLSHAARRLRQPEPDGALVGGVGGIFFGYPLKGFLFHLQNNEYVKYAREIGRRWGRADVLTGTATLFSVRALRHVRRARSTGELPASEGVYDVEALTEDNELTLALKHLGYRCVSPRSCTVGTELMPTIVRLFYQRLRWQRGALENLRAYGLTVATLPYIIRQLLMHLSVMFLPFYLTVVIYSTITQHFPPWTGIWVAVTVLAVFERIWSVKRGGWRSVGLSALVIPEILYDIFQSCIYTKALIDIITGARRTWERQQPQEGGLLQRNWDLIVILIWWTALLAGVIAAALLCVALDIAWQLIAVFVLGGSVAACVRLSMRYPTGMILRLSNGELAEPQTRSPHAGRRRGSAA
jgi:cellulose synthase/poly-beta-1,6-N-acetylglucosamine synthase-like glycosyltransferase